MKKALKWTLIILGGLIVLIIAAAALVPVIFKDDIKAAINEQIAKSVNADVVFEDFDLSLFRNFPSVTVEVTKMGVVNREPFAGQALFAANEFHVEVNLADILFGDQMRVKGISLLNRSSTFRYCRTEEQTMTSPCLPPTPPLLQKSQANFHSE